MNRIPSPVSLYGWLFLLPFALLIAGVLISSYGWRPEHDTPHLQYAAWLWHEHQLVPYRDLFETSMPGTLGFHVLFTGLLGFADSSFRLVDIISVCIMCVLTARLLWPWGRLTAASAAVFYAAIYLGFGQSMSLQRDYLGLLLLIACLNLITVNIATVFKGLGIGFLLAAAALIKPHLVIGAPWIIWLAYRCNFGPGGILDAGRVRVALAAVGGSCVALGSILLWLGPRDALPALWQLLWEYLPLYNQINGDLEILPPGQRLGYHLTHLGNAAGFGYWIIAAAGGLAALWLTAPAQASKAGAQTPMGQARWHRDWSVALLGLLISYALYVALAGKYWAYHFMPLIWFSVAGSCLLLAQAGREWNIRSISAPGLMLALILTTINGIGSYPALIRAQLASADSIFPPKAGRVDEIGDYLRAHAQPGDTAQPLDVTGGAVHGMLDARIPAATPFIYDYHFYHHPNTATIQQLRQQFMAAMQRSQPRFVIEVTARNKPHLAGPDTTTEFASLRSYLEDHYRIDYRGKGFVIYLRQDS